MKSQSIKLIVNEEEKEFKFNALAWEDFPKLMGLTSKFKGAEGDNIMDAFDEETMAKLMDLEFKMFNKSYPNMNEADIKAIILDNMFVIMPVLFELNLGK